ncbi:MAG: RagB/SusD family nutrient uptake outer membrane protein [Saprospiraceae bacterium]|nr:RagB/SusD family nutrient uptake outer membrane protein [Saprospiraceae bacterium]
MKQLKYPIYILFISFFSVACSNLLEEDPQTFYNEDQVFSSEEGLESAINGLYSQVFSGAYYGSAWHGLLMPVSGKFFSSQNANLDANSLNTTPSNVWLVRMWPQMYAAVNTANVIINNLENTESEFENRDIILGQAYFVRAWVYFDLVRLFGGVPLRTLPTTASDLDLPRASKEEVYALIIEDFERSKALLPAPAAYRPERPTPFTASAFLAKVYMTMAGEDGGDPALWQKAYEEAQSVIQNGPYALTPTFAELFEPGNENTVESIFEIQYGNTGGIRNSDMIRFYTPANSTFAPANTVTFGRVRPNKEVFDAHVERYPSDPRIDATFIYDSYEKIGGGTQKVYPMNTTGNNGFAAIRKWLDPSFNGITTTRNFIVFRYADLLLMMAEIENEINGPDAAYTYVNQVLARARDIDGDGISDVEQPADWSGLSQEEFRTAILQERQFELLAEGHAWFDTRRRGYEHFLEDVVEPHNNHPELDLSKEFIYPISIKNMLLPIPLIEISGNQMISPADQNPGY